MAVRPDQGYFKKSAIEQPNNDYGEKKEKRGKYVTFVTYFAESTSFIGISKMWASRRMALKVMWALFFLSATGMLIYQLVKLIGLFSTFPVKTSVKLGFSPLPFPSVTVCNMNPIKLSKANELGCELQKALELDSSYQSEEPLVILPTAECATSDTTIDYSAYKTTDIICDDDDNCHEEQVTGLDKHYIRREMIADYLTMESVNFTWLLSDDLGNCYTFDFKGVRAKKTGPETGLSMVINLEPEEFISTYMTGYGLRVVVHPSGTRPFPDSEGFIVSAASETSITIKMTEIVRLPPPYGTCNKSTSFKEKFGVEYTKRACREFCVRGLIIDKCKCQPETWEAKSGSVQACNEQKDWQCEEETTNKYTADTGKGIEVCKCGLPCNEKVFQTNVFSRSWPVLAHVKALEEQVCKENPSSPKCNYTDYDFDNVDKRTSSFLKLKVYYESLNFEKVKEEPFYDIERFLSDIGGTMGLWLGASVLSVAEFIEILIELLCCCFGSRPN